MLQILQSFPITNSDMYQYPRIDDPGSMIRQNKIVLPKFSPEGKRPVGGAHLLASNTSRGYLKCQRVQAGPRYSVGWWRGGGGAQKVNGFSDTPSHKTGWCAGPDPGFLQRVFKFYIGGSFS